jgi:hypothetical protein
MLLVASVAGAVPGVPVGLGTALDTAAGILAPGTVDFAAGGAALTLLAAAAGAFGLLLRIVRPRC